MTWWARSLHNCSTTWLFILAAIHAGFRGRPLLPKKPGFAWLGIAAFLTPLLLPASGLYENLFLLEDAGKFPESLALFLFEYGTIAAGFYFTANLALYAGRKKK